MYVHGARFCRDLAQARTDLELENVQAKDIVMNHVGPAPVGRSLQDRSRLGPGCPTGLSEHPCSRRILGVPRPCAGPMAVSLELPTPYTPGRGLGGTGLGKEFANIHHTVNEPMEEESGMKRTMKGMGTLVLVLCAAGIIAGGSLPANARSACTITGTPGNDVLSGTAGPDVICGLGGHDRITAGDGNDVVRGGAGRDKIIGGPGDDVLKSGGGRDRISGGTGVDRISGGALKDRIQGNQHADLIRGGGGRDVLFGGLHADRIRGGKAGDSIRGSRDNDTIWGNAGRDVISAGEGNDRVTGGKHVDELRGRAGDDLLDAVDGEGGDLVRGMDGTDTCLADPGDTVDGCEL
jgi:hypothetical protein